MGVGEVTIPNAFQVFPIGTAVGVYERMVADAGSPAPVGDSLTEAVVAADGSLTFKDLELDGTTYVAAAEVGDQWLFIRFTTVPPDVSELQLIAEREAREEADSLLVTRLDNLEIFNVRDFGAIGDDSTPCAAAFQAALDEAKAHDGGLVLIPSGAYVIESALTIYDRVHIRGAGEAATSLRLADGVELDGLLVADNFEDGGIANFSLSGFSLDGNKESGASGNGLRLDGYTFRLEDLHIHDFQDDGIFEIKSKPDGELRPQGEMDAFISKIKVWDCEGSGVNWDGHDCHFSDVVCISNAASNFLLSENADASKCNAVHAYGVADYGIRYQSFANKFVNCEAEGATEANVLIEGDGSIWIGPEVFADSDEHGKVGFEWAGGKGFNTIIIGGSARGTVDGALKFTGSGDNSRIVGFVANMDEGNAIVGDPGEVELDVAAIGGCDLGITPPKAFAATYAGTGSTGVTEVTAFSSGWKAGDPVRYWREGNTVHLEGKIESGEVGLVFTLPEGFRPENDIEFGTPGGVVVTIETNGQVKRGGVAAAGLTGCSFRAAGTKAKPAAENAYEYVRITVPLRVTLTGIRYRVGDSSDGNVRVGIYNGAGELLQSSASTPQGAARSSQSVQFKEDITVGPGGYYLLIQFSSDDASCERARALAASAAAVGPNFEAIPAEIAPSAGPENVDRPILVTY